ncbi:MAG: release factor glutamine methyltransferase [Alphaproteobacteria bacterium]
MILGSDAKLPAVLKEVSRLLRTVDIENAAGEARLLVAHATGLTRTDLLAHQDKEIIPEAVASLAALVQRRMAHEPMSHLLGRRGFWTLEFEVGPVVLDPRPDSETLVEAALDLFPNTQAAISVLDLGTGSGCLLLSVLAERAAAWGVGVDVSPDALAVAARNATDAELEGRARFVCSDWGRAIEGPFDLILCNPPYIQSGAIEGLAPEVAKFEPHLALDGGVSGYDAYGAIGPEIARLLRSDGAAVVEAGAGQMPEIARLFSKSGLALQEVRSDLGGIGRAGIFRPGPPLTSG